MKLMKNLNFSISKLILNGPEDKLQLTQNTHQQFLQLVIQYLELWSKNLILI